MKITFFSNFLNHHQLPFCKEMYKILGDAYKFVATEPIPEERLQMGYHDMGSKFPFAINTYSGSDAYQEALRLGYESDVVIIGSAAKVFIKKRLKENKLTFHYSERIFKKGRLRLLNPRTLASLLLNHTRYRNKNLYMLCASAYTAADFSLVGAYKNKSFKWGYFPENKDHDLDVLINKKKKNKVIKLLWVGRFLDWKHPDDAIKLARMLKEQGYTFLLNIIGTGPMEVEIKKLICDNNLKNEVTLLGSMSPEGVRNHMENANIFLFTSDFNEGWGAVLNEAMNSACAVVASHAIGSVPFLLKNKENGLIYKNGDVNHLYKCVFHLINNMDDCFRMGENAYNTLHENWDAKKSASRFIELSNSILNGEQIYFEDGPCSKAEAISQKYTY